MNLPLDIARRTAQGKASSQSVMVRIAEAAVAVSVAVMIVALTVIAGFRSELTSMITGMAADITVTDLRSLRAGEMLPMADTSARRELIGGVEGVRQVSGYAVRGGVLRSNTSTVGVMLKGVDAGRDLSAFVRMSAEGEMPRFEQARRKEIVVSEACAETLGVRCGDRVELLTLDEGGMPGRDLFKVCAIYRSGLDAGGTQMALTDIRNVQKINGWEGGIVSGYEVMTTDFEDNEQIAGRINNLLATDDDGEENISAISAQQLYSEVVNWLGTHDVNAAVIIAIMLVVALFNMVTALLILVMERTRMIGILKSMGMPDGDIRRIFLYRAAGLIGKGLLWGNAVGLGLVLLQQYTHVIKLDAAAYMVPYVPVSVDVWQIAVLDAGFAAVILAMLFVATSIVSRISPTEAIRYE